MRQSLLDGKQKGILKDPSSRNEDEEGVELRPASVSFGGDELHHANDDMENDLGATLQPEAKDSSKWRRSSTRIVNGVLSSFASGVPDDAPASTRHSMRTGSLLTHLKARDIRRKYFCDFLRYLTFLALLYCSLFINNIDTLFSYQYAYHLQHSIKDLVFLEEFRDPSNIEKNYYSIGQQEDLLQWLNGPLIEGLFSGYPPEEVGPVDDPEDSNHRFILQYNKIIGTIRLRQARVRHSDCAIQADSNHTQCFPHYKKNRRATEPFGTDGQYTFSDEDFTRDVAFSGAISHQDYDAGGYLLEINVDDGLQKAKSTMAKVKFGDFLDEQTRALFINFNIYNANIYTYCSVQAVIEFLPEGLILPNEVQIWPVQPAVYVSGWDYFRLVCEISFVLFLLYYIYIECLELRESRAIHGSYFKYFRSGWNILDMISIGLFLTAIVLYIMYLTHDVRVQLASADVADDRYIPIGHVAKLQRTFINLIAVNVLLSSIKTFKFLQANAHISMLWQVLEAALPDLFSFGFSLLVIYCGFAFMGHLLFGRELYGFRNLMITFSTLAQWLFGDFNYEELSQKQPTIAWLYFYCYMLTVYLILINVFIAILNHYFAVVHAKLQADTPLAAKIAKKWKRKLRKVRSWLTVLKRPSLTSVSDESEGSATSTAGSQPSFLQRMSSKATLFVTPPKDDGEPEFTPDVIIDKIKEAGLHKRQSVTVEELKSALGPKAPDDLVEQLLSGLQAEGGLEALTPSTLGATSSSPASSVGTSSSIADLVPAVVRQSKEKAAAVAVTSHGDVIQRLERLESESRERMERIETKLDAVLDLYTTLLEQTNVSSGRVDESVDEVVDEE